MIFGYTPHIRDSQKCRRFSFLSSWLSRLPPEWSPRYQLFTSQRESFIHGWKTSVHQAHRRAQQKYSFCSVPIKPITITLEEDDLYLFSMTSMLTTAWEVLTLSRSWDFCQKHFRKMQRLSKGWITGDCFMALMKSRIVYFARWAQNSNVVLFVCWSLSSADTSFGSCIHPIYFSPILSVICWSVTDSCNMYNWPRSIIL